jgi:hypothetical protein
MNHSMACSTRCLLPAVRATMPASPSKCHPHEYLGEKVAAGQRRKVLPSAEKIREAGGERRGDETLNATRCVRSYMKPHRKRALAQNLTRTPPEPASVAIHVVAAVSGNRFHPSSRRIQFLSPCKMFQGEHVVPLDDHLIAAGECETGK